MTIVGFLDKVNNLILNPVILLLFGLSFVYFLYGIVKFLKSDADDKSVSRIEARKSILWGMVGMLIMFSVYGIIKFVLASFGITPSTDISTPARQFLKLP
ncbi:MAG: hypothetical protein HY507_00925 [Candidatus Zambryskibacteria bacterium]|nr:hypothetical protein [Candidatus Zambryskibacteria bacterium]